jgi:hypothetical protein
MHSTCNPLTLGCNYKTNSFGLSLRYYCFSPLSSSFRPQDADRAFHYATAEYPTDISLKCFPEEYGCLLRSDENNKLQAGEALRRELEAARREL